MSLPVFGTFSPFLPSHCSEANPPAASRGTAGLSTTSPPVPMSESSSTLDKMAIRVVSAKEGGSIEGVDLQFTGRIGIRNANRTLRTDAAGKAELAFPEQRNQLEDSLHDGARPVTYPSHIRGKRVRAFRSSCPKSWK